MIKKIHITFLAISGLFAVNTAQGLEQNISASINGEYFISSRDLSRVQGDMSNLLNIPIDSNIIKYNMIIQYIMKEESKNFTQSRPTAQAKALGAVMAGKKTYNNRLMIKYITDNIVMKNFIATITGPKVKISQSELDSNINKFNNNEPIHLYVVESISIPKNTSLGINSYKIAKNLSLNLNKHPDKFFFTALMVSTNTLMSNGPRSIFLAKRLMSEQEITSLNKIKVGQITEPIESSFSYSIYKLVNVDDIPPQDISNPQVYGQIKSLITSYLEKIKFDAVASHYVTQLEEKSIIMNNE